MDLKRLETARLFHRFGFGPRPGEFEAALKNGIEKTRSELLAKSKSEIVVPLIQNGIVIGVLDVDSEELANFDATDSQHLEELCSWLVTIL